MPSSPENEGRDVATEDQAATDHQAATATEDLEQRNADLEDRYKRALADLDNYRKRSARDLERRVQENAEAQARQWLEAIDSVERALRMEGVDPENPLALGLRHVLEQMESILERQGVRRVGEAGERFDPERHEAVAIRETDEVSDQTVVEVARSGWAAGDRVLRPAQVVVARPGD
jgi:molecular chaperone GrpE